MNEQTLPARLRSFTDSRLNEYCVRLNHPDMLEVARALTDAADRIEILERRIAAVRDAWNTLTRSAP